MGQKEDDMRYFTSFDCGRFCVVDRWNHSIVARYGTIDSAKFVANALNVYSAFLMSQVHTVAN